MERKQDGLVPIGDAGARYLHLSAPANTRRKNRPDASGHPESGTCGISQNAQARKHVKRLHGCLKKQAFAETPSRGPVSGPKPRPIPSCFAVSQKLRIIPPSRAVQKKMAWRRSRRVRHRLRPDEHEQSGPHLTDRCSPETRLQQGSHLCRQSFRSSLEATRGLIDDRKGR